MTLLHTSEPPYMALSEPLVHLRVCVGHLVQQQLLSQEQADNVIYQLKNQYFGNRTLTLFYKLLAQAGMDNAKEVVGDFDRYRIKNHDLENFLYYKVWEREPFIQA